jgi:hypothetical protein
MVSFRRQSIVIKIIFWGETAIPHVSHLSAKLSHSKYNKPKYYESKINHAHDVSCEE